MNRLQGRVKSVVVRAVCVLCFLFFSMSFAAPSARLMPYFLKHRINSTQTINHQKWQSLLSRYVVRSRNGLNLVRYSRFSRHDRRVLAQYLKALAGVKISQYSRREQLAYWIDLYNVLTVDVVLKHYPIDSIRNIKLFAGWFGSGHWDAKLVTVEGQRLSLNDIEHRILRPIWRDSRVHYAVNCASIGCPNLQKTAYTGKNVYRLLNKSAREYVNSPRGAQIKNGRLTVSKIYVWFKSDFGGTDTDKAVIQHLIRYARPVLRKQLSNYQKINGSYYDWRLNGV